MFFISIIYPSSELKRLSIRTWRISFFKSSADIFIPYRFVNIYNVTLTISIFISNCLCISQKSELRNGNAKIEIRSLKSYVDQYIHMNRPRVVLAQNSKIEVAVNNVLTQLDLPDLNGKRILLKPNVGREEFSTVAINTNPKVVEIIFHFLKKSYKCDVFIGDSPIVGADTREAFRKSGYDSLLKEEITYLDLDEPKPTTLPIQDGKILQSIRVTGYWNDFDYIISIPVLKMHMHTGASLSFKNCKGLIYKRDKVKLHHYDFPDLVAELRTPDFMVKELDIAIADLYPQLVQI